MLRPNLLETTKRPGNFCTWTLAVWAPEALDTMPRFKLRWPELPPERAAPSGALTKLTEIVPSVADLMDTAVEVRLAVPLRCAHAPVEREKPTSKNAMVKRKLMLHLRPLKP